MFITPVDGIVILVILVSAFLAMVRGLSREILSLFTWVAAAVAAYFLYSFLIPFFNQYLSDEKITIGVSVVAVFFLSFLILYPISMKISDIILDSRAGVLDRTFGFLFGILRGVIILALAALLVNHLVKPENLHPWLKDAKTKPMLDSIGDRLVKAVPDSVYERINGFLNKNPSSSNINDENAEPAE